MINMKQLEKIQVVEYFCLGGERDSAMIFGAEIGMG